MVDLLWFSPGWLRWATAFSLLAWWVFGTLCTFVVSTLKLLLPVTKSACIIILLANHAEHFWFTICNKLLQPLECGKPRRLDWFFCFDHSQSSCFSSCSFFVFIFFDGSGWCPTKNLSIMPYQWSCTIYMNKFRRCYSDGRSHLASFFPLANLAFIVFVSRTMLNAEGRTCGQVQSIF